jgi:predicted amidophosphoribosyltransferase
MFLKHLFSFVYPSKCLYCAKALQDSFLLLCPSCISTLHFAYHPYGAREIYCFEKHSAASSLLKAFEETSFLKLKDLLVSFMVVQYLRCHDCLPDWIIPALRKNHLRQNPVSQALAVAFAQRVEGRTLAAFTLSLESSVYDHQGNLKVQMQLKHKALITMQKGQSILIVSDYSEAPDVHRKTLLERGYEQVSYLSIVCQ